MDPHRVVVADLANDTGDSTLTGVGVLAILRHAPTGIAPARS